MLRIYGLDLGVTSVGWSVIESDDELDGQIKGLGVRIFPETRDPQSKEPLNAKRRMARMARRQTRRRRARRRAINEVLTSLDLLPPFGTAAWDAAMSSDPYALRKAAFERPLTPHELGRALYRLAKNRQYKARDFEDAESVDGKPTKESAEDKKEKGDRATFIAQVNQTGLTLGAYLHGLAATERKRGRHAERSLVVEEFDRLVSEQGRHHSRLTPQVVAQLRGLIFHQRPVFWRKSTLGVCRLVPGAALAPKASWASQQRRMLEKLNNIAFAGGNGRPLDSQERAAILAHLQTQASMTWGGARKALAPLFKARGEPAPKAPFNLEGSEKKLMGHPLEAKLARIFGQAWLDHPHKSAIRRGCDALRAADYAELGDRVIILDEAERRARRRTAVAELRDRLGLSEAEAAGLDRLTFPTGWDAFSVDALSCLLPRLEEGARMGDLLNSPTEALWRAASFPDREAPTGAWVNRLPSPMRDVDEQTRLRDLRNPTVVRVQNELRKVVNNLIAVYGKPDLIRVELAREVGLSGEQRNEMQKRIRANEKRRTEARKALQEKGVAEPSRADIERWLLWRECDEVDPYSGDHIGFEALFRDFDVEHIWPRSQSQDDSFGNKTLCRKDLNHRKGNRLPYEAFGSDAALWEEMQARVRKMESFKGGPGMSRAKVRRFLSTEIPEGFTARQLVDTSYAARQAIASLKRLWPDEGPTAPVRVQAVTGRVTAHLRRLWGLNNLFSDDGEKTRADHRHHAIDALVVACAHPGMTQRLSRYWQLRETMDASATKPFLPPPWPDIRAQARAKIEDIVVSHRVRKKASGALHKETIYGDTKKNVVEKRVTYGRFVVRKKVETLSAEEIANIRDERVRTIVSDWVEARGGKAKDAFPPHPTLGPGGHEIRKVRTCVKQQRHLMLPVTKTGFADPGDNHHIAIFRRPDGSAEWEVVPLYEAARRLRAREPVVRRELEGASFVMSLSKGETIRFPAGEREGLWVVTGVWASPQIILERLNDAARATTYRPGPASILETGGMKVSVDPIGRLRTAGD